MFKLLLSTFFLLLIITALKAQPEADQPLKELVTRLQKSKPDTNRLLLLLKLSEFYLKNPLQNKPGTDSPFLYLQQAIKLSDTMQQAKWRYETLRYLGNYYISKGDSTQGKACFLKVIDDLNKKGQKEKAIRWWLDLAYIISFTDTTGIKRIDCYKNVALIYAQLKDREKEILTEIQIAKTYMYLSKFDLAEKEMLAILEKNKPVPPRCLNYAYFNLSIINRYKGNFPRALYYCLEMVKSLEKSADTEKIDYFYGEVAQVYQELGETDKSIEWYRKTFEIRKKMHQETYVIYRTAGFLIEQLLKQKREKEAVEVMNKLPTDNPPFTAYERAILFQIKGNYYNTLQQYEQAEKYYLAMIHSKGFAEEKSEITTIAYQDIGEFYLHQKEYAKASEYLLKSLDANDGGTTQSRIKDIHLMLFKVDSSTGNYFSAIGHLSVYQQIKDSLFNEAKSKQIQELAVQYETGKKEQSIQLLEKETLLQQTNLVQAKNTRNWILGGVAGLLIIMGLLINNSRLKQQTNKKLEAQQKEIRQQNHSLQQLVNEKEWLVKEIHHRVKNNFHIVIGLLGTQSGYLKNEEAITAIAESQQRIHAMSLIHQKLYQSDNLSAINMPDYIYELVEYLKDSFDIRQRIHFKMEIERIELDLSHSIPVGLILNEAINNSIKYGFPGNKEGAITIILKYIAENRLLLSIADNGKGLPTDFHSAKNNSMGMNLMRGLSEDIGGSFTIESKEGTSIGITFTFDPELSKGATPINTYQKLQA